MSQTICTRIQRIVWQDSRENTKQYDALLLMLWKQFSWGVEEDLSVKISTTYSIRHGMPYSLNL